MIQYNARLTKCEYGDEGRPVVDQEGVFPSLGRVHLLRKHPLDRPDHGAVAMEIVRERQVRRVEPLFLLDLKVCLLLVCGRLDNIASLPTNANNVTFR